MSKINVRPFGKEITQDLSPERLAELQKMQLDIERIKANKQLEGENLSNFKQARVWGTVLVLILLSVLSFFSIPKILSQRYALKNGYCLIDGNTITKENVPLALQYQYAKKLASDAKMSLSLPYLSTYVSDEKNRLPINEQIIKALAATKKDLVIPVKKETNEK